MFNITYNGLQLQNVKAFEILDSNNAIRFIADN